MPQQDMRQWTVNYNGYQFQVNSPTEPTEQQAQWLYDDYVKGADELELVRSGLDDTMREALQAMREKWHEDERVEDLRLAAYMIAIQKIALTYQSKSLG